MHTCVKKGYNAVSKGALLDIPQLEQTRPHQWRDVLHIPSKILFVYPETATERSSQSHQTQFAETVIFSSNSFKLNRKTKITSSLKPSNKVENQNRLQEAGRETDTQQPNTTNILRLIRPLFLYFERRIDMFWYKLASAVM